MVRQEGEFMRAALYQMEIAWEDKEKNYKKLEGVSEECQCRCMRKRYNRS